ncbi:hypothetical protein ACFYM2_13555 [Streptomyces sp. NPDC006711]|uniref:hypothetical protein n=1 Tax=unclassified Streptomyces TaxID=2593676 RepID=UPI0033FEF638
MSETPGAGIRSDSSRFDELVAVHSGEAAFLGGSSWHIPDYLAVIGGGMWLLDVRLRD